MKRRKRDLDEAVPRPPAELIDELAIHIADGRNVLFITGAGLSVSAGIPAFRSGAGAVWEENVVQYGTRKSLRKDPVEWHNAFWLPTFETKRMKDAKPTKAHDALAELAQLSPAIKVVTQNVDALHVGGGVPDAQLVEAHGRAGLFRCCGIGDATEGRTRCEESVANKEWYGVDDLLSKDRKALQAWWRDEGKPVTRPFSCPRCGAFLAPLSLLFDENYDSHFFFEVRRGVLPSAGRVDAVNAAARESTRLARKPRWRLHETAPPRRRRRGRTRVYAPRESPRAARESHTASTNAGRRLGRLARRRRCCCVCGHFIFRPSDARGSQEVSGSARAHLQL